MISPRETLCLLCSCIHIISIVTVRQNNNQSFLYTYSSRYTRCTTTSLGALGVPSVGILYLHSPDQDAPLEGALAAVDELHRQGKIREFGLSNFSAWQTVQVYYKCKELGYVLPTVYQGVFSAKLIIENCRGFAFANRSK